MPVFTDFTAFCDRLELGELDRLDVVVDADAELSACQALTTSGILLLGECHGVAENAVIVLALVDRWGIDTVALEWPAELQDTVDGFAQGGRLIDDPFWSAGDGRVSVEHLVAVRALASAGVRIVLIDCGTALPRSWSQRDRDMADAALAAATGSGRALVLAGNLHTPMVEGGLGTPMGAWISHVRPGVREIVIRYGSGSFFNLEAKAFADRFGDEPFSRLRQIDGALELRLPHATTATVLIKPNA